ncbi:MAG: DUF5686 family protein [Cytophagales bacterium]|nr:DUF5686 family protein [Cytophagales bacterium]MDW8383896.1 DUF5686 family protein [Flammeovirgaceae bacterium]
MKQFGFCLPFLMLSYMLSLSWAQVRLEGSVSQHYTHKPLPFACIKINYSDTCYLTDGQGNFLIQTEQPIRVLQVIEPLHRPFEIHFPDTFQFNKRLEFSILQTKLLEDENVPTRSTDQMVQDSFLSHAVLNNPDMANSYECFIYNKFSITTSNIAQLKARLNRIADKFEFIQKRISDDSSNHHRLILMESLTKRELINSKHYREILLASRIAGVEKPVTFTITSQLQPFTLYEKELIISGKHYYSPTIPNAQKWYKFYVKDTLKVSTQNGVQTLLLVMFYPRFPKQADFVKGFLWLDANDFGIHYALVEPSFHFSEYTEFIQSYQKLSNGKYFPSYSKTAIYYERYNALGKKTTISDESFVYEINFKSFRHKNFDHIRYNFRDSLETDDSEAFWQNVRKIELDSMDKNTYRFYEEIGSIKSIENITQFGEALVFGEIPVGTWNILINKIIDFNEFEGMRVGFGGVTNEYFSDKLELGGYVGYGLNDNIFKYGLWGRWHLQRKKQTFLELKHTHDIREAGETFFISDKFQFNKEPLRRFRVRYMDKFSENELGFQTRIFRAFTTRIAFAHTLTMPQYLYSIETRNVDAFYTTEYRFSIKYAPDEYFLQSLHRQIPLRHYLPIIWVQYAQSTDEFTENDFIYRKIDLKFQHTAKILGWGITSIQVRAGKVWGSAPYSLLYNGRGSYRPLAAISHNSFETMLYNEFLSNQHISIHWTHRFGTLNLRQLKKRPTFLMCHNIGFGSLASSIHKIDIDYKTMERGFFESGLYLNNIFVVKLPGLQAGLGAGAFARYGAYAYPALSDNFVFKLALDIQL